MKHKKALRKNCIKKRKFQFQKDANKRVDEIFNNSGNILYSYKCNVCDGWHLTSKTPEERKSIKKIVNKVQKKYDNQYKQELENEAQYWINKKGW